MLEKRCDLFFKDKVGDYTPIYVDGVHDAATLFPVNGTVDIVFFGGMIQRLLELPKWDFQTARLWVLSTTYRKILSRVFNISESHIGLIERNDLFKQSNDITPLPSLSDKVSLIYAGRISPTKNIDSILKLTSLLQVEHGINVQLSIYGEFDNEINLNSRPQYRQAYRDYIENLIEELSWTNRPILHGEKSEAEWIKSCPDNSVLISLSKYLQEDFGVSVGQWSELGRPMILSDWGGHRDLSLENVFKVPPKIIPSRDDPSHVQEILISRMSALIADTLNTKQTCNLRHSSIAPISIDASEIKESISSSLQELEDLPQHILKGEWELFCTKELGQNFISKIESYFDGSVCDRSKELIISNWFESTSKVETQFVPEISRSIASRSKGFEFVFFRDIHLTKNFKKVMMADTIHFPYYIEEMKSLLVKLIQVVNIPGKISITLHPSQFNTLNELKNLLRPCDCIKVFTEN